MTEVGDEARHHFARSLLAAIVASSDDAIISETPEGIITSWNRSAERIFGYPASEAIGQCISMLEPPDNVGEMPLLIAKVLEGKKVDHFETTRRRKDGTIVNISLSISPVRDEHGRTVGLSKIARDITTVKLSAAALQRAESRLLDLHRELLHATRLGELGQMAATLAHEVNQPLSAIASYLAGSRQLLVQNDMTEKAELEAALGRAADQVVRASEIVRRLRSYAKPSEGNIKPEGLGDLIRETAALVTIDPASQGVTFHLAESSDTIIVMVDRIEVQQVLLNIMRNGLEAMVGQRRRELSVVAKHKDGMAEIRISDTGIGIDPRIRDRLFLPFATTKADGMGIGLSICRKIVDGRGGRLWAEHPAQGGTTFVFTMPIAGPHDMIFTG